MIKRNLGLLAFATLFTWGCGDKAAPTQPSPPAQSFVPVVSSAEPTNRYYGEGWIIRGLYLNANLSPKTTFESAGSQIVMELWDNTSDGTLVGVTVPDGTVPGEYTPCVQTKFGKGCGSFLVNVK